MFFYLSKVFWFLASPGNAFLIALILGLFLASTRFRRTGRWLVSLAICFAIVTTFVPVGPYLLKVLEDRFPAPESLPGKIDGIVVLGGVIDPVMTEQRGRLVISGAIERITMSATLAHMNPDAKLVYTGGSGSLTRQDVKEADYVADLYEVLGIPRERLTLERESRNTWENAKFTMEMISPKTDENWILVTSAFHMPRAVGAFRRVGWEMIPYPVDYKVQQRLSIPSPLDFGSGLSGMSHAGHEWIGLIAYWLTGKNSAAFPKPRLAEAQ
ncbi:MAG: YdcF family protein [Rhodospirillales bacterium]|nr:YdcF family protein [Rhodospirillales bacterium]